MALQSARRHLKSAGIPAVEPVRTRAGDPWAVFAHRLVELEPFVAPTHRMNTLDRVATALPLLGRVHTALSELQTEGDPRTPVFSNYLPLEDIATSVALGTRRIRSWTPTFREASLADSADRLVERILQLECRLNLSEFVQLVHGDFWDKNVLFSGDDVVLVTDFDFLGRRPRVEDLALTLYFVSIDITDLSRDKEVLGKLVDAYESGLDRPLAEDEREALPIAMARQPLWSVGVWVACSTTRPLLVVTWRRRRPLWSGGCGLRNRLRSVSQRGRDRSSAHLRAAGGGALPERLVPHLPAADPTPTVRRARPPDE